MRKSSFPQDAHPHIEACQAAEPIPDECGTPWRWIAILLICAFLLTFLQTVRPYLFGVSPTPVLAWMNLAVGLVAAAASFAVARRPLPARFAPRPATPVVIALLAAPACLLLGGLAGSSWPNSGDEHAYVFLADTLLKGRLTNPAAPDPELFTMYRVFTMRSQTFSAYLPGLSLVLAPFRLIGVEWLVNPLLTTVLGLCLLGAMNRLSAPTGAEADARPSMAFKTTALVLVLATPFALFNGASLFTSTLSAALIAGLVFVQLVDEDHPALWRKLTIGALLGMLILTRADMFLVLGILYGADRLWRRRAGALLDALPVIASFAPFLVFMLIFDKTITGRMLETPLTLTDPKYMGELILSPGEMASRTLQHMIYWLGNLQIYGGFVLMAICVPALAFKARQGQIRFFDLMLPATLLFYMIFPYDGGHQYGPRYWFSAWPLAILTLAGGYVQADGAFFLAGRRFHFGALAAANLLFCAAMLPGLTTTTRGYIDARRAIYAAEAPVQPAIVLLPMRAIKIWDWQWGFFEAGSRDFVRNDVDYRDPVLYGRDDVPDSLARACRLTGRAVFIWTMPGVLERQTCLQAAQ